MKIFLSFPRSLTLVRLKRFPTLIIQNSLLKEQATFDDKKKLSLQQLLHLNSVL